MTRKTILALLALVGILVGANAALAGGIIPKCCPPPPLPNAICETTTYECGVDEADGSFWLPSPRSARAGARPTAPTSAEARAVDETDGSLWLCQSTECQGGTVTANAVADAAN